MKRKRKPTGLFRKKPLTTSSNEFRVISVNKATNEILVRGQYTSLREAQEIADGFKTNEVDAYVQGQQNRVLYQA